MTAVQVLTVDDQAVFLEAARALIASTPGFVLAGEVGSGAEAIRAVEALRPDLVLLDVRMPGLDGIETAHRIAALESPAVVVLVTGHDPEDMGELAQAAGAAALVPKERLRPRVLRDIWAAHRPRHASSHRD
jgi:DNA-binding NarL/FixJ family response regulator